MTHTDFIEHMERSNKASPRKEEPHRGDLLITRVNHPFHIDTLVITDKLDCRENLASHIHLSRETMPSLCISASVCTVLLSIATIPISNCASGLFIKLLPPHLLHSNIRHLHP